MCRSSTMEEVSHKGSDGPGREQMARLKIFYYKSYYMPIWLPIINSDNFMTMYKYNIAYVAVNPSKVFVSSSELIVCRFARRMGRMLVTVAYGSSTGNYNKYNIYNIGLDSDKTPNDTIGKVMERFATVNIRLNPNIYLLFDLYNMNIRSNYSNISI